MKFQSFDDVQNFLDSLGLFNMDFELTRMAHALTKLGLNHLPYKVVQVVGTNGKGSTATFLASLAKCHGLNVGLYTSPHFVTPRERICINGEMLYSEIWMNLLERILTVTASLTYFELLTVLAVLAFAEADVDLAILEAGLGGQYDATTAVSADLVCYTPIDIDHEQFLGTTVKAIVKEKAQAMRFGKSVLTSFQQPEVMDVLYTVAQEKNCSFQSLDQIIFPCDFSLFNVYPELSGRQHTIEYPKLGMIGNHQRINAQLALAAWQILSQSFGWNLTIDSIYEGLSHAFIPGRFQYIPLDPSSNCPPTILDGAHNPHGLRACIDVFKSIRIRPGAVIFSCFADKNVKEMVKLVKGFTEGIPLFIPTIQVHERAMVSEELAQMFEPSAQPVQRLNIALKSIQNSDIEINEKHPIVIFGSLYLLGEFFTLYPHLLYSNIGMI